MALNNHQNFLVNPYIAGSPIKDTTMFFGREDVYAWLRQHLVGAYQDNVIVLYGERRSGKTSILYQMKRGLGDDRYIPVLLDLQGMGLEGMAGFLWEIARKIVLSLRGEEGLPRFDRPRRQDFESTPRRQFEEVFLRPIIDALGEQRLLLMFDETNRLSEKVRDGQLPADIFDYIRALTQLSNQVNFLFTLGRQLEGRGNGSSSLFNIAVYRKISFLDQDYAEDLIVRPVAEYYTYTRPAIDRILRLTAGQPYYTQLLCHNLFTRWTQEKPERLEVADVDAVLPDVLEQGTPNFQFVWEDSSPAEKAALAAMAHTAPRYRGGVMRRNLERTLRKAELYPPATDLTSGLKNLFERDVLNEREPYEFRVKLVQLWLTKFKQLEWVAEELGETAKIWKEQEHQRRAKADKPAEKVRRWVVAGLVVVSIFLLVAVYQLMTNIQQVRQESSAALNAAEIRRATEAASFEATVAAASTEVARLQESNSPEMAAARATAQAAEAIAAIALAQITATVEKEATMSAQIEAGLPVDTPEPPSPTPSPVPTATPPPSPTPTATPAPTTTPQSAFAAALQGTIAYPAFMGETYNLYFGDVASGESRFYRGEASQPAFSADGKRIAFISWAGNSRGLITASSQGGNEFLISNFLEDKLPTWSPDGQTILFLSRRTGDRRSLLYRTRANIEFLQNQATEIEEGEYPSWSAGGQIVFKGWGRTSPGLRLTTATFNPIKTVTGENSVFAPAISPDGRQIAFMQQDASGNWDIYSIQSNGFGLKRLTTHPARDGLPTWRPDGRSIAFVSNRDETWAIYGINADGSGLQKLLEMAGSPDGIVFKDQANSGSWLEERISWSP